MNNLSRRLALVSVVMVVSSCGDRSRNDAANTDRLAVVLEAIAGAAVAAGEDCGAMASAIEAVFRKQEAEMRAIGPWLDQLQDDEARQVKFAERLAPRMVAIRPQLVAITRCGDDPRMQEAQSRLKAMMKTGTASR